MSLDSLRRAVRVAPLAPDLVGRALVGRIARRVAGRAIDTASAPGIGARAALDTSPRDTLGALLPDVPVDQLDAYEREYEQVDKALVERAASRTLPMPPLWRTARETGLALYTLTRALQPEVVVETGTANGWSSVIFLRALAKNGSGALHSFDVRNDVGGLIDPEEKERWQLHLLDSGTLQEFDAQLAKLPPIGLFFHDSDHSYLHMRLELRLAGQRLASGGALTSDDVSLSHAYIEACEELGLSPRLLVDGYKASGFAVR
ncbi:MAG: class I SAM-dependent methyltransferase [Patulibacter sp.]